jgi:ER-bound oxygenase mpaB/B'/Rubber oxygenase, catalytic domain
MGHTIRVAEDSISGVKAMSTAPTPAMRSLLRFPRPPPLPRAQPSRRLPPLWLARVRGVLREAVGRFPAGTSYDAMDPELSLWVHATLIDTSLVVYQRFVTPLTYAQEAEYWADSCAVAQLLGIPESMRARQSPRPDPNRRAEAPVRHRGAASTPGAGPPLVDVERSARRVRFLLAALRLVAVRGVDDPPISHRSQDARAIVRCADEATHCAPRRSHRPGRERGGDGRASAGDR